VKFVLRTNDQNALGEVKKNTIQGLTHSNPAYLPGITATRLRSPTRNSPRRCYRRQRAIARVSSDLRPNQPGTRHQRAASISRSSAAHRNPGRRSSTVSTSASTRLIHASNRHGTGRPRATHHNDHPDPFPDPNGGAPRPRPWRQCFHLPRLHQWLRKRRFLYAQEPRPSYRLR
jgi:hypothetical protein